VYVGRGFAFRWIEATLKGGKAGVGQLPHRMTRYESQTRVSHQRIDSLQCLHCFRDGPIEADTYEVYQRWRENMTLFQAGGAVLRYRSEQRVAETVRSAESRVVQEELR
jgi:hypothetical protein